MALTRTLVNTTCCHAATLPTLPPALYEQKTSAVLTASAPISGAALMINVTYCAAFTKVGSSGPVDGGE